jgi:hypothetical protein
MTFVAYPTRPNDDAMRFGAKSMSDHAGFQEVAHRKPHRQIVRIETSQREKL